MRQGIPTWDEYFMEMAQAASLRSKDPTTRVGAVLVSGSNRIIAAGYNGFAPGVEETAEKWQAPQKYERVIHAEMNAVAQAARMGHPTEASTLYVTLFPCLPCMKIVLAAGVRRVVAFEMREKGLEEHLRALELCIEAGVPIKIVHASPNVQELVEQTISGVLGSVLHHTDSYGKV